MAAKRDVGSFFEDLNEKPLPPVIAVGGPERVLVDDAVAIVRERALAGGLADFNHDRVKAARGNATQIVSMARTLPTMAPRRLVEVHDADDLGEDAVDPLQRYLDDPVPETVLLFVFGKMDKRQKVPKLISKHAESMRFEHPRERDMPDITRSRAKSRGIRLDYEVAEALALTVGTEMGFLDRALEKLALVADGRDITIADISEHVADTRLEIVFALSDAVALGDRKEALERLAALRKDVKENPPIKTNGNLAWKLRQVLRAREMLDDGQSERDITQQLRAFGPGARKLIRAARRFAAEQHARRLRRLALLDRKLKFDSQVKNDWLWMERIVMELCPPERKKGGRKRAARP